MLDKATGNVRVGYQNANGTLSWATSVPSGVAHATSMAVGRFLHASRDSVAVTSEEFNRVHVLRLESPGVVTAPIVTHPPHAGLSALVALNNVYVTGNVPGLGPDWLASNAHDPGITLLDLLAYSLTDLSSSFQDQIVAEGVLKGGSALRRENGDVSLFAAMRRMRAGCASHRVQPALQNHANCRLSTGFARVSPSIAESYLASSASSISIRAARS